MSGDIAKAFPDGELFQIAETPDNYQTPMSFDENVLGQFENAITVLPTHTQVSANLDVTQSNQMLVYRPSFKYSGDQSFALTRMAFNSHKDEPDYKDVIEWTRLMSTVSGTFISAEDKYQHTVTSVGLELPWYFEVIKISHTSGSNTQIVNRVYIDQYADESAIRDTLNLCHFDWHPFIYPTVDSGAVLPLPYGDTKVVTLVDADTVKRINDCAVYGAFFGAL
jgi:hypothetical protein